MPNFEVNFFRKEDGSCPVAEFLSSLDKKMRAKLLMGVALLEEEGPHLREPYSKSLGDGIFELRAQQGGNITRVLYFFVIGRQIILTNGFIKKTQKTPEAEITIAKRFRTEYLSRKEQGQ
ncbi:MAG: type II toxin-antitoxin system RelE/ParE family toxin [Provencibacterium sp.]|jgi:phage-related protein|nr:type II toxin-antitoxin system RelE/ParE family toxin [Provencibacterium sp.]